MRINKYIAHAGIASRRKAEELIKQGLVTLNGQVITDLATTVKSGDVVEIEGSPIYNEEKVYYLLNKPRGAISSVSDDKGRKRYWIYYLRLKNAYTLLDDWIGTHQGPYFNE